MCDWQSAPCGRSSLDVAAESLCHRSDGAHAGRGVSETVAREGPPGNPTAPGPLQRSKPRQSSGAYPIVRPTTAEGMV
jgi:hypothetical protein